MSGGEAAVRFWDEFRGLYVAAGSPPLGVLTSQGTPQPGVSVSTLSEWLNRKSVPSQEKTHVFLALTAVLQPRAKKRSGYEPRSEGWWQQLLRQARDERDEARKAGRPRRPGDPKPGPAGPAGWLLDEVRDPFALEVHRPVQLDEEQAGLEDLPPYLPREHDAALARMVTAAAQGRSQIAVLVGGSSTGKTRACWEALHPLRDQPGPWRLWHPIDPTRPAAALRDLPGIGPRTVVWLNEAQFYLEVAEGGLGEQVAAGLRELLRDPGRAPVLVLATLWPQFWDTLTARPAGGDDRYAQARDLLAGHDIAVPAALTPAQVRQLTGAEDPRLALAAAAAKDDGQAIQFLAGAPVLLARYRNAPPAAAALVDAAMDARRLGMGASLPQAFLEAAAPGYLTDAEWDALGEDWPEPALAYTALPCKGARGPLTRIRPRPVSPRARARGDQPASMAAAPGPLYRLADYLDQHGRTHRASQIPPAEFWSAAAAHAAPGDQAALGGAAHARGLYRDAAQLHKNAAASGNLRAVLYLSRDLPDCLATDPRPAHWAATYISLNDPGGLAYLLDSLRRAGAGEQVTALLARDPAAHAALNDPGRVAGLLGSLREAGAEEQVTALLARDPAAHVALDNPNEMAILLGSLRRAGAEEQIAALLARDPAAHVVLDGDLFVANLLDSLRDVGAYEQFTTLADRAAAHAALQDLVTFCYSLDDAWAWEQVTPLAGQTIAHAALDNPGMVAGLLGSLRKAGAGEQVAALLARDPAAHAALNDPGGLAHLLNSLRDVGAEEQITTLLARDPAAHAALNSPGGLAHLLDSLRTVSAQEQVTALASRASAHAPLDNPGEVAALLDSLRRAGAGEQVTALLARDPAAHAALDSPREVGRLLGSLREADAGEQVTALADRAAAHVALDDPHEMASLLVSLREADAGEQVTALLARDPAAHAALDGSLFVANLLDSLDSLREAGAQEQAAALAERLSGEGMFELFRKRADPQDQFRYGREANGSPAKPWDWGDLD